MFSSTIFWPWVAGLTILLAGLVATRKSLPDLIALGPVFFAAPLAAFGAEHLTNSRAIAQIIPAWMPGHLFWTYFVGLALISASVSIALKIYTRLSATLLSSMFILFVMTIHIPNAAAGPHNRILWAVALRDLSFAGGALALSVNRAGPRRTAARVLVGVPLVFFALEHFLHPEFVPGVPLAKLTPDWVPLRAFWGYLTGTALLVSGATLLAGRPAKVARSATLWLGALITALVLFLYLPIFLTAQAPMMLEGVNYVADTLLFAGTVLLAAATIAPRDPSARDPSARDPSARDPSARDPSAGDPPTV